MTDSDLLDLNELKGEAGPPAPADVQAPISQSYIQLSDAIGSLTPTARCILDELKDWHKRVERHGSKEIHPSYLLTLDKLKMREARKDIQMIFQDPLASLNPRMTAGEIIAEPLKTFYPKLTNKEIKAKITNLMNLVGLIPEHINRYPHEFSGGQCQRIGIARALILNPKIIVCDEPVSALDVSIQAQIVNLLKKLQRDLGLTLIFIAHDLSIVKHISDRIMVMYLGRPVEIGTREQIYKNPQHPYTKALLSAVPIPDPELERNKVIQILQGDLPSPINPPSGCRFRTRCPVADASCALTETTLKKSTAGALTSCLKVK